MNRQDDLNNENQVEGSKPCIGGFRSGRTVDKLLIARGSREGIYPGDYPKAKRTGRSSTEVDRRGWMNYP